MPKQLQVVTGPDQGRVFPLPEADTVLIGRSRALESRLMDPYVSRVHCQVEMTADQAMLTDFESAAGTFVNGKRASRYELQPGDVIRIGDTFLQYQDGDPAEQKTLPPYVPSGQ